MVNLGRSSGCRTCKRRRVKCDENGPSCNRCVKANIECKGYESGKNVGFIFKNTFTATRHSHQNHKSQTLRTVRKVREHHTVGPIWSLPADEENLAFGFFLNAFVGPSPDHDPTRGFLGSLEPALSTASVSSPVFPAFSAVATQIYGHWRHTSLKPSQLPKIRLVQALERLQAALQDPVEMKAHSTLIAVLLLQFRDNVTSVWRLQIGSRVHQNGALALAIDQGRAGFQSPHSKHIVQRLINTEMSSEIRGGQPVSPDLLDWYKFDDVHQSPSSDLDKIGISVAKMQRTFAQITDPHSRCKTVSRSRFSLFSAVCVEATAVEKDLIAWVSALPTLWTPLKVNLKRHRKTSPPIQTYLGNCEVYPSIQIASIWNTWRYYRLVALTTILTYVEILESASSLGSSFYLAQNARKNDIRDSIQNIVDSICSSVPFHLGNRVGRGSLEDLDRTDLEFPTYHCLPHDEFSLPEPMKHSLVTPCDTHKRHVLVQGPWHIINPLSRILSMCSGLECASLRDCIKQKQISWIQGQFRRCATILGLDEDKLNSADLLTGQYQLLLSKNLSVTIRR